MTNETIQKAVAGYDEGSPDGDKTRLVLRFPDGQLKTFVPEEELLEALTHHDKEKAGEVVRVLEEHAANRKIYNGKMMSMIERLKHFYASGR